jgi:hypothetical protein
MEGVVEAAAYLTAQSEHSLHPCSDSWPPWVGIGSRWSTYWGQSLIYMQSHRWKAEDGTGFGQVGVPGCGVVDWSEVDSSSNGECGRNRKHLAGYPGRDQRGVCKQQLGSNRLGSGCVWVGDGAGWSRRCWKLWDWMCYIVESIQNNLLEKVLKRCYQPKRCG